MMTFLLGLFKNKKSVDLNAKLKFAMLENPERTH
jgi:hypothetical protein